MTSWAKYKEKGREAELLGQTGVTNEQDQFIPSTSPVGAGDETQQDPVPTKGSGLASGTGAQLCPSTCRPLWALGLPQGGEGEGCGTCR